MLEVTEGILIDNPEETLTKLEALRALGVSTALDDFGTGYSSLNYLQKFPFDRLKIDRCFVASLGTTGNTGAIIQSIVTLGHALGMKVLGGRRRNQRAAGAAAACRLRRDAGLSVRQGLSGRSDRQDFGAAGRGARPAGAADLKFLQPGSQLAS